MSESRRHAEEIAHRLGSHDPAKAVIFALLKDLKRGDRIEQALEQVVDAAASVPDSDDLGGLLYVMGRIAMARDALAGWGTGVGASV